MKWSTVSSFALWVQRKDGHSLLVYVAPSGTQWVIAAVESDVQVDGGAPVEEAMARVFASHSHVIIKPEPSVAKAMTTAEKYARWWKRSLATHTKCPCETIEHATEAAHG
jgi:hypothetical protein